MCGGFDIGLNYSLEGGKTPEVITTQWSVLLEMEAIFNLTLTLCTVLMCVGMVFPPYLACGVVGQCCGCCAHLAILIVTAVFRFSKDGGMCSERNWAPVTFSEERIT